MSTRESQLGWPEAGAIAAIILIWGYSNVAAQQATHALPPLLTGGLRFAIAPVPLIGLLRPPFPSGRDLLIVVGLGGPVQFGLLYLAFSLVDGIGPLVVSLQLWIPFSALLGWLLLSERVSPLGLVGLGVAFAGVAIMSLEVGVRADLDAILIGLVSSGFGALATVWVRRLSSIGPFKLQALVCAGSAPVLLILSWMFEGSPQAHLATASLSTWLLVLFAAVGSTLVATILMFRLVQKHGAGRITPWFLLTPLVSVLLSLWLLDERLSLQVVLGGAAALAGIGFLAAGERLGRTT